MLYCKDELILFDGETFLPLSNRRIQFIFVDFHFHCLGESDKIKDYLPKEKQFLVTKQVPCHKRCKDIQYSGKFEKVIEDDGPEGDGGTNVYDLSHV